MTFPNPGPASQSTGNVAGGPYVAWSGTNATQVIGPSGTLVNLGGGVGGVALYDGANSITSGTAQFSNANGVTFGFNGQTITASVVTSYTQTNQTVASGGIAGSGFTTATTAGTAVVGTANSAGVSIGVPKYITTYAAGAATGISSIADSANTQTVGMLSFANSHGVTFGISTGALTATITGSVNAGNATAISGIADSANTQTVGTVSFSNANGIAWGLATGANTATLTASYSVYQFGNSNGISFGSNGSTVTGSYTVPATAGLISGLNVSGGAGTSNSAVSGITFNNANGITFGVSTGANVATVTASYTVPATAGFAGTNSSFGGTNVSGSITLNTSGLSLSLSAAAPSGGSISRLIWPQPNLITTGPGFANATVSIQYVTIGCNLTASRLDLLVMPIAASTTTSNTMGIAMSQYAIIYTRNVSTLSSLSSGSTQTTYTYASNTAGNTELFAAVVRPISVPININMTPGEYFVGFNVITNTTSIGLNTTSLGFSLSIMSGPAFYTVSNYAEFGSATATSNNFASGMGLLSQATTGMPTQIGMASINATGINLAKANIALVFRNV